MPSERKIEEYLTELERLQEEIRNEDELSGKIVHAKKASDLYVDFRKKYQKDSFEVHSLMSTSKGGLEETPFDWRALDSE